MSDFERPSVWHAQSYRGWSSVLFVYKQAIMQKEGLNLEGWAWYVGGEFGGATGAIFTSRTPSGLKVLFRSVTAAIAHAKRGRGGGDEGQGCGGEEGDAGPEKRRKTLV